MPSSKPVSPSRLARPRVARDAAIADLLRRMQHSWLSVTSQLFPTQTDIAYFGQFCSYFCRHFRIRRWPQQRKGGKRWTIWQTQTEKRGIKLPSNVTYFPGQSYSIGSRGQPAFKENSTSKAWIKVRSSGLSGNLSDLVFVKDFYRRHKEQEKGTCAISLLKYNFVIGWKIQRLKFQSGC